MTPLTRRFAVFVLVLGSALPPQADPCVPVQHPVSQEWGVVCEFGGGSISWTVTASTADCPWIVHTSDPWIRTLPTSGTGTTEVSIIIEPNASGTVRAGMLVVEGPNFLQGFRIDQASIGAPAPVTGVTIAE